MAALQTAAADGTMPLISRSLGLALFGLVLLGAGVAFRTAAIEPALKATSGKRQERNGQSGERQAMSGVHPGVAQPGKPSAVVAAPLPRQSGVVVALRRVAVAERPGKPKAPSMAEIERLQNLLHSRAMQLRSHGPRSSQRRFPRHDGDNHGTAQSASAHIGGVMAITAPGP